MDADGLRGLPRVDRVVANDTLTAARTRLGDEAVTRIVRRVLEAARVEIRAGKPCPSLDDVAQRAAAEAARALGARARRVINATGVVLHTNLGRAPLAPEALAALAATAGGYTSIELDLASGQRGPRGAFAERALVELTGAEAALVVNNNAAATLLALSAITAGKRVLVSRGELVEIGGGFRVPDVCARSGAELVEVGTTNKTRAADYARAIDAGGVAAILRVHPGNFRQIGFVERPELGELAELARARGVALILDLGGGALVDLTPLGLVGEPVARKCVEAGCDLVCFSTDKLLGGPQGGVLVGKSEFVERARRDPLARALRLGRLPLIALEATLAAFLEGRLDDVPTLRMLREPVARVRARAEAWRTQLLARGVASRGVDLEGAAGGGALAEEPVRSFGVALPSRDPQLLAALLRDGDPAVLARVRGDDVLVDARTVQPGEEDALLARITACVHQLGVAEDPDLVG